MAWVGAVLTGGASRRMGRDKASLPIDGVPMAVRVAGALRAAGADEVVLIGHGVGSELAVPDDHPGEGPLGGVLTALRWAAGRTLVVAPCDLVTPDEAAFRTLVAAVVVAPSPAAGSPGGRPAAAELPAGSGRSVPASRPTVAIGGVGGVGGVGEPLPLALTAEASAPLQAAFDGGERSVRRAVATLHPSVVELPAGAARDADSAAELPPGAG